MKNLFENSHILNRILLALTAIVLCVFLAIGIRVLTNHDPKVEVGTYCQTYAQELKDPSGCKFIIVSDCHGIAIVHSPKCPNH